jgi:signal transduction histidine kinase
LVADNGAGIPTDHLRRVFDPFYTTRLGAGQSGLGLYITHNIVTGVLAGQIDVSSTPGHGSTFTLRLPAAAPL